MAEKQPHQPEGERPPESKDERAELAEDSTASDAAESSLDSLKEQLEATRAERDEMKDHFLRTRAEMENFRKRVNRERDEERRYASAGLIGDLLPALDNLKRAVESGRASEAGGEALIQGVEMVLKQFDELLSRHGAEPIPAQGERFDPNYHEALQQVPTHEHPPMTVIQELEQGVKLHDRVIRPSKVIVSSTPPPGPEEGPGEGKT